jgi:hypothetical protein
VPCWSDSHACSALWHLARSALKLSPPSTAPPSHLQPFLQPLLRVRGMTAVWAKALRKAGVCSPDDLARSSDEDVVLPVLQVRSPSNDLTTAALQGIVRLFVVWAVRPL